MSIYPKLYLFIVLFPSLRLCIFSITTWLPLPFILLIPGQLFSQILPPSVNTSGNWFGSSFYFLFHLLFYSLISHRYAITGGGTVSIPLQFSIALGGLGGNWFYVFIAGAPFITLDCQKPLIISAIGISFALKVGLPWLPPGINTYTIFCILTYLPASFLFGHFFRWRSCQLEIGSERARFLQNKKNRKNSFFFFFWARVYLFPFWFVSHKLFIGHERRLKSAKNSLPHKIKMFAWMRKRLIIQ